KKGRRNADCCCPYGARQKAAPSSAALAAIRRDTSHDRAGDTGAKYHSPDPSAELLRLLVEVARQDWRHPYACRDIGHDHGDLSRKKRRQKCP
ncbi:hypothetical protein ABTL40_19230, partial [Acinetobacter baumannii]